MFFFVFNSLVFHVCFYFRKKIASGLFMYTGHITFSHLCNQSDDYCLFGDNDGWIYI